MAQAAPIREIKTVAVIGYSGKQGSCTVKALAESNKFSKIYGISRDPNKGQCKELCGLPNVTMITTCIGDKQALTQALQGVDGVFLMTPGNLSLQDEIQKGHNVIDACKQNNVAFVVHSSVGNADKAHNIPSFNAKFQIENYLKSSGLSYFIMRPTYFMENFATNRDELTRSNTISLPLPSNTKLHLVSAIDVGRIACQAFQNPSNFNGRTLELAFDLLDMNSITKAISQKLGTTLKYNQLNLEEYKQKNPTMGAMYEWLNNVGYSANIDECKKCCSNYLSFDKWLQQTQLFRLA